MEELYKVKGLLNAGFVGQITYTVCLPAKCSKLDICMKFSKQHFPSADLNDEFIGCIHKQKLERHMIFSASELSEGCVRPDSLEGVLKVTVLVFNVLMDETPYEVSVHINREEK